MLLQLHERYVEEQRAASAEGGGVVPSADAGSRLGPESSSDGAAAGAAAATGSQGEGAPEGLPAGGGELLTSWSTEHGLPWSKQGFLCARIIDALRHATTKDQGAIADGAAPGEDLEQRLDSKRAVLSAFIRDALPAVRYDRACSVCGMEVRRACVPEWVACNKSPNWRGFAVCAC